MRKNSTTAISGVGEDGYCCGGTWAHGKETQPGLGDWQKTTTRLWAPRPADAHTL